MNLNNSTHQDEIKKGTVKTNLLYYNGEIDIKSQFLRLEKNLKVSFLINNSKSQSFIPQQITFEEINEIAKLEAFCYSKNERYDFETLWDFLSERGMASIRITNEETNQLIAFHLFQTKTSELITLDVHPNFRRLGYGTGLVNKSLEYLKKINHNKVTCEIATTNEESLRVHYKLGFQPIKTLNNYYGKNKDAYLLSASL